MSDIRDTKIEITCQGAIVVSWATGKAAQKAKALGVNDLSLAALTKRNELSEKMIEHVATIAAAAAKLEELAESR